MNDSAAVVAGTFGVAIAADPLLYGAFTLGLVVALLGVRLSAETSGAGVGRSLGVGATGALHTGGRRAHARTFRGLEAGVAGVGPVTVITEAAVALPTTGDRGVRIGAAGVPSVAIVVSGARYCRVA